VLAIKQNSPKEQGRRRGKVKDNFRFTRATHTGLCWIGRKPRARSFCQDNQTVLQMCVGGLLNMHGNAQKSEMHFQHDADYTESG